MGRQEAELRRQADFAAGGLLADHTGELGTPAIVYCLAMKRNEALIHATTWMNLRNVMLSERSQKQKKHILHDSIYAKCPEKVNL